MQYKMQYIQTAHAKINIGLDVIRRREDGYHEVRMIMQTLQLGDEITMQALKQQEIIVETSQSKLPNDERNLAYKAAKMMMDQYAVSGGVSIKIEKKIPIAAGMAGGSADAAAVLKGMNELYELGLSEEELQKTGVKIGADVPYCIMEGTALAEGIGEKLTALEPTPDAQVLIAKPDLDVSTKYVYEHLTLDDAVQHPDIDQLLEDIKEQDLYQMTKHMGNILETVTLKEYPVIQQIKQLMLENGAIGAMMSGSGPTVFGIFDDKEMLEQAYERILASGYAKDIEKTGFFHKKQ